LTVEHKLKARKQILEKIKYIRVSLVMRIGG
jgi:hypothetical protein